jgi:hypothetical protein
MRTYCSSVDSYAVYFVTTKLSAILSFDVTDRSAAIGDLSLGFIILLLQLVLLYKRHLQDGM